MVVGGFRGQEIIGVGNVFLDGILTDEAHDIFFFSGHICFVCNNEIIRGVDQIVKKKWVKRFFIVFERLLFYRDQPNIKCIYAHIKITKTFFLGLNQSNLDILYAD